MARNKAQVTIKTDRRLTPMDVKLHGTLGQPQRMPKVLPRPPTVLESRANNMAGTEFGKSIGDVAAWKGAFEEDLERMNRGKVGRPYEYSDLLIVWCMAFKTLFSGSLDVFAGFCHSVLHNIGIKSPSPSRLDERMNEMAEKLCVLADLDIKSEYGEGVLSASVCGRLTKNVRRVGVDSSGLSMSSSNCWRKKKWGTGPKDRGWLKIHALCDVDSGEIIAYALTTNEVGDAPLLRLLMDLAMREGHMISTVYADGAYSSDENWAYLCRDNNLKFVTSFKVNTSPTNNGCVARGEAARLWCSLPYDEWRIVSGYGTRWKGECVFSDMKRIFPETVESATDFGIVREVHARVMAFNKYKEIRADIMGVTGNGVNISA